MTINLKYYTFRKLLKDIADFEEQEASGRGNKNLVRFYISFEKVDIVSSLSRKIKSICTLTLQTGAWT